MTDLLGIVVTGLYSASLIAIGAVGFTLQFGVANVLNLAFSAVLTSAVFVHHAVGGGTVAIGPALLTGAVWGAAASWVLGQVVIRAFVRRGATAFGTAMVTIALGLIVQFGLQAVQGPATLSYTAAGGREYRFGTVAVSGQQVAIVGAAVAVMAVVHVLLRYTRIGLAMRATADDVGLARGCGVSAEWTRTVTWLVSGALCGVCGVFLGLSTGSFDATLGGTLFVTIVAAAVLGGVGKPYGAMAGALVIGVSSEAAASMWSPAYKNVVAWCILIGVLALRPQGIFAEFATHRRLVR